MHGWALTTRTNRLVASGAVVIVAGGVGGVAFIGGAEAAGPPGAARAHPVVVKGQCEGPGRWRMELGPSDEGKGMSGTFVVSGLRPREGWGGALDVSYKTSPTEGVGMSSEYAGRVHKDGRISIGFGAPSHYRSHVAVGLGTRDGMSHCSAKARSRF